MKKIAFILALLLCLPLLLLGCTSSGNAGTPTTADKVPTQVPTEESTTEQEPPVKEPETVSLDGKKIIFIGNSFIYYGQTVLEKKQTYLTQAERANDKGYFYQLCKANGEEVSVTNWTFGGHTFDHLFGGNCSANRGCDGVDHKSYLTDLNYDYVVLSASSSAAANDAFWANIEQITTLFKNANPNVKFVYLCHTSTHGVIAGTQQKDILNGLKTLEDQGFTVVDWGKLVSDIAKGNVAVPGALQSYNKNSFIVEKSASDGYHPNQLAGYITTLMTYCAITGKSAVGQTYDFAETTWRTFSQFKSKYYTYNGATTNYPEIFKSESDMKGIQELIDQSLEEKPYREYQY
ncbi:MAG: hypothetical protein IJX28_05535 [Clostridia bacterium]|nr:hypothetical protein [Clostridia bacterium]